MVYIYIYYNIKSNLKLEHGKTFQNYIYNATLRNSKITDELWL